jgi:hypothetical protein
LRQAFLRFGIIRRHLRTRACRIGSASQTRAVRRSKSTKTFPFAFPKLRLSGRRADCSRSAFKKKISRTRL